MNRVFATSAVLATIAATAAQAQQAGQTRVLACNGPDAQIELYLPAAVMVDRKFELGQVKGAVTGTYVLDLSEAGKGKVAEPVQVTLTSDRKAIVVNQYTRKLPPTTVPLKGGTVSFDNRFATDAACGPFGNG